MEIENKRTVYMDILNIISCIAVCILHCNGIVHTYSNSIEWRQALVAESIFYFAVPIFIMITGATLFNYRSRYNTKEY